MAKTNEEKAAIYRALSAPFSEEAIQRTEGRVTGRGYDTTGVGYQFIANRLNEVLGIGCYRTEQDVKVREGTTAKGRAVFDASCDLTLQLGEWVDGKFLPWGEAFSTGGHQSVSEADARKGAYTNAFKKAAAMMGCGKQAYEGSLDDDNAPAFSDGDAPSRRPPARPAPAPVSRQEPQTSRAPVRTEQQNPAPARTENNAPPSAGPGNSRNRLTSKQLSALWALARKLNYQQQEFRQKVKARFGVQPEFLDKDTASQVIGEMSARAGNGASHPAGEHAGQGAGA